MSIFSAKALETRQANLKNTFFDHLQDDELVVIFSGVPIHKPGGMDQTYEYLPHPEYFWLTGSRRAGGAMLFHKDHGWEHFVTPLDTSETVWEGRTELVDGRPISELANFIARFNGCKVVRLGQNNHQITFSASFVEEGRLLEIQELVNKVRRPKDEEEISLIKRASQMAGHGFSLLQDLLVVGKTETQLKIAYESEVQTQGSQGMPYDTIVGAGSNAGILHAHPSSRILCQGEYLLVDAGAQIHDYCVDITRTYCVGQEFDERHQKIYDIVKKAQAASIDQCRVGVDWVDVHNASANCIAEGLIEIGLLRGDADALVESGAVGLFFPHGVGHMVGQRVRDVGGDPTREIAESGGAKIRVNITLDQGHIMTVEPGLYFIPTLLNQPKLREKFQDSVAWDALEPWMQMGGVRLEDDILVTDGEPDNLTEHIPK